MLLHTIELRANYVRIFVAFIGQSTYYVPRDRTNIVLNGLTTESKLQEM